MKTEWGIKRACRKCSAHFYDMNKPDFSCPKCHTSLSIQDYAIKPSKNADFIQKKEARKKVSQLPLEEQIENLDTDIDNDIDAEDLIEDTADLDTEDVHDVIKHEGLEE